MHKAGSINALGIGKYAEEANTVDIADDIEVKVRGNLTIGQGTVADFPVEVGANGIWTYRKWNSGIAECWGTKQEKVDITQRWEWETGNVVCFGLVSASEFPFKFAATPHCQVTVATGNAAWHACNDCAYVDYTQPVMLYRAEAIADYDCYITYYAIGRYK
jgi:hypothetical protein